jgi:hypothetical protein
MAQDTKLLADDLERAQENAAESHKEAMNSYGAGYDAGYLAAIIHAREQCGPMYGALENTVGTIEYLYGADWDTVKSARAALSKARGE